MTRVLVVGEPLVELLEDPPGTIRRGFGGDALNLAVTLKRESQELDVLLASAVGDGSDSEALLALCRDEGIDVSLLRRVAGAELGRYRVAVDAAGERSFTYDRSASPFRGALDADGVLPDGSVVDVLCFSGIAMAVLHDAGRRTLLAYATAVHERGGTVVYDPNHRPALWTDDDEARAWTERIVPTVDVLLASTEDGLRLTDADTPVAIADAFRAMGAREIVVTDGVEPVRGRCRGRRPRCRSDHARPGHRHDGRGRCVRRGIPRSPAPRRVALGGRGRRPRRGGGGGRSSRRARAEAGNER